MATISALREKEKRDKEFLAAINGVDLNGGSTEPSKESDSRDIIDLMNPHIAKDEGFGVGEGLGFMQLGG
jgi:hypothetical protein